MEQSLFVVEPALENGQVVDVLIRVADELPLASDPAAQEKQALYVALDHARTVVKTVAARIESRTERFWRLKNTREREQARAKRLKNQYMKKLVDIGRLGLQHSHIELAKLALEGFRAEFVAQEAGRIKNTYLSSLGAAAGLVAILLFLGYALISCCADKTGFFYLHKIFLIAAGGAAIGTWLSFSIRRVTLGFDDLSILEEDFLDPSLRILFVIALTVVVFLLFWTGAMNIEIGNLKTGDLAKPNSPLPLGAISLLVGIFCGIAERSLATAVAGRASGFVKSINL
jgi:hypothetical protein